MMEFSLSCYNNQNYTHLQPECSSFHLLSLNFLGVSLFQILSAANCHYNIIKERSLLLMCFHLLYIICYLIFVCVMKHNSNEMSSKSGIVQQDKKKNQMFYCIVTDEYQNKLQLQYYTLSCKFCPAMQNFFKAVTQ